MCNVLIQYFSLCSRSLVSSVCNCSIGIIFKLLSVQCNTLQETEYKITCGVSVRVVLVLLQVGPCGEVRAYIMALWGVRDLSPTCGDPHKE